MKPLTWEQIRNELEVEIASLEPEIDGSVQRDDRIHLGGFAQGMIAAMCLQRGWAELPEAEQHESARLQKWLVGVCAK